MGQSCVYTGEVRGKEGGRGVECPGQHTPLNARRTILNAKVVGISTWVMMWCVGLQPAYATVGPAGAPAAAPFAALSGSTPMLPTAML